MALLANSRARCKLGRRMDTSRAMIAITTNNSINVKPFLRLII